jgi:hypothetical protein
MKANKSLLFFLFLFVMTIQRNESEYLNSLKKIRISIRELRIAILKPSIKINNIQFLAHSINDVEMLQDFAKD